MLFAGRCYQAMFAAEDSEEAEIAGEGLAIALDYVRAYVEAMSKRRRR